MHDHTSNSTALIALTGVALALLLDLQNGIYRLLIGRNAVLIAVVAWFLLEAIQTPLALLEYTQSEYDFGVFCIIVSVTTFLSVYHSIHIPLFARIARLLPVMSDTRVLWLLVISGMTIGLGSILIYSGFDYQELFQGLAGPRRRWTGLGRGRYGSWSTILYELQMFLQATMLLAVALLFTTRAPLIHRCIAGLFLTWIFLRTFWSGTRGPMVPILIAIGAATVWSVNPRQRRALLVIGTPIALLSALLWSAVVVAGRNEGKFELSSALEVDYVGYEMFRELLYIIRETPRTVPLQMGMTYFTQIVNPIPRAIWPGKPVADAGLLIAKAMGAIDETGEATMTNSPGFIGEAYLNFGFLGLIFVPAVSAVFVRAWDDLFPFATKSLPAFLVYTGGLAAIFTSGRSFNMSTFYGLLSLMLLLSLFRWMGYASPTRNANASNHTRGHPRT